MVDGGGGFSVPQVRPADPPPRLSPAPASGDGVGEQLHPALPSLAAVAGRCLDRVWAAMAVMLLGLFLVQPQQRAGDPAS